MANKIKPKFRSFLNSVSEDLTGAFHSNLKKRYPVILTGNDTNFLEFRVVDLDFILTFLVRYSSMEGMLIRMELKDADYTTLAVKKLDYELKTLALMGEDKVSNEALRYVDLMLKKYWVE